MSYDALVETLMESPTRVGGRRRAEVTAANALVRVVVDATCDLPEDFCKRYEIGVMPITVEIARKRMLDLRGPEQTMQLLSSNALQAKTLVQVEPISVNAARDDLAARIRDDWTHVVIVSPASSSSNTFVNVVQASQQVGVLINRVRKSVTHSLPFQISVIDSGTLYSGVGLLAYDAIARVHNGLFGERLVQHLEAIRRLVHTYYVVDDVAGYPARNPEMAKQSMTMFTKLSAKVLRTRPVFYLSSGRARVARRTGSYDKAVDHALSVARRSISEGLKTPAVCISIGGDVNALRNREAYRALEQAAAQRNIRLLLSPMSMTETARLGARAVSVAFASSNHHAPL